MSTETKNQTPRKFESCYQEESVWTVMKISKLWMNPVKYLPIKASIFSLLCRKFVNNCLLLKLIVIKGNCCLKRPNPPENVSVAMRFCFIDYSDTEVLTPMLKELQNSSRFRKNEIHSPCVITTAVCLKANGNANFFLSGVERCATEVLDKWNIETLSLGHLQNLKFPKLQNKTRR